MKANGKFSAVVAMAVAGVLPLTAVAGAPSYEDLQRRIEQLESRLGAVEVDDAAVDPAQVENQVDATISKVLANADRRSQLLAAEPVLTGHDGRSFVLRSEDGNFVLRPGFQFQYNYIANIGEDADGDDRTDAGFQIRRARLELGGNLFTPKLTYGVVWGSDRSGTSVVVDSDPNETKSTIGGGSLRLEDAWVKYQLNDDWSIRAGQFKDPIAHEEIVSSKRLLTVERSIVNELLLGGVTDRVQGVGLTYGNYAAENPWNAEIVLHDGISTSNTNYTDSGGALGVTPDYGIGGRLEYKVFGDWKSYADFSARGNKKDLLVLGAAAEHSGGGDSKALIATLDAQWEVGKWGLYTAGVLNDVDLGSGGNNGTNYGFVAQAGYAITPVWEVFGRGSAIFFDDDFEVFGEDTISEYTVGVNWYLGKDGAYGHRAKITFDVGYLPDGAPGISGIGVVGSDEEQFVFRSQFQILL